MLRNVENTHYLYTAVKVVWDDSGEESKAIAKPINLANAKPMPANWDDMINEP